jgi:hypothetical protein
MRATVSINKALLLKDAKPGEAFIVHAPELNLCVCTLLLSEGMPLVSCDENGKPSLPRERCVVVIACLLAPGDCGYVAPGSLYKLPYGDYTITPLEQVEPSAFRERAAADVVPYRKREIGVFETFVQTAGDLEAAPPLRE